MLSFLLHSFCGQWGGFESFNYFNHTSWMAMVTQTNLPKSVRNRYVIEVFGCTFVISLDRPFS